MPRASLPLGECSPAACGRLVLAAVLRSPEGARVRFDVRGRFSPFVGQSLVTAVRSIGPQYFGGSMTTLVLAGNGYSTGGAIDALQIATSASPNWSLLKESSLYSLGAAVVLVAAATVLAVLRGKWKSSVSPEADWDFSDSWASNVTIGASALAAVFASSDVATAVGGDDATVAPLIVVGSAIALAAVTSAPLLVKVFSANGKIWTAAIAVAAVLTLWAAGLEGLVIVRLASDFRLGGIESWTPPVAAVLGGLLAVYAVRSLWAIFTMEEAAIDGRGVGPGTRRRAAIL